jgi:hypothetical protein
MPEKRPRGRPRLPDDRQGVRVTTFLQAAFCDNLIRRAQREDVSVSALLRKDLELVAAWRQRKRDGDR